AQPANRFAQGRNSLAQPLNRVAQACNSSAQGPHSVAQPKSARPRRLHYSLFGHGGETRMETPGCECGRLDNLAVVPMGHHDGVFRTLQLVRKRGMPQWWLGACTCSACGQTWLIAQEERHNDLFILRRLDAAAAGRLLGEGAWPPDFDRFETLLEIGR